MKKICFIILLVIWVLSVRSAPVNYAAGDSVGTKQQNGNSYIIYKVSSGETVYSVARKYQIPFATIASANPGVNMNQVKAGQTILIPATYQTHAAAPSPSPEHAGELLHTVTSGETLYSIARNYSVSFRELMEMNPQLTNYEIQPGQKIHVPSKEADTPETTEGAITIETQSEAAVPEVEITVPAKPEQQKEETAEGEIKTETANEESDVEENENVVTPAETPATQDIQSSTLPVTDKNKPFSTTFAEYTYRADLTSTSAKGVATWIDGSNDLSTTNERYYALHNSAPIGSVIRIRNLMNNRTIYAKVIGTLSEDEVNEKVMVKLSAGAAQKLNVLDNRFVVEATFFTEKNTSTSQK